MGKNSTKFTLYLARENDVPLASPHAFAVAITQLGLPMNKRSTPNHETSGLFPSGSIHAIMDNLMMGIANVRGILHDICKPNSAT